MNILQIINGGEQADNGDQRNKSIPMYPDHNRKSRRGPECFLWHSNIQIQTFELIITWNGIVHTTCDQNQTIALRASRPKFRRIKRGFKRTLCSAMSPPLVKCSIWNTTETSYTVLDLACDRGIEGWGAVFDLCSHLSDVKDTDSRAALAIQLLKLYKRGH